jgi:hypothetical protein
MLRIEPRLALINGVLLANRVLIFRFQLLTLYVLLVHNCGECRIVIIGVSIQIYLYSKYFGLKYSLKGAVLISRWSVMTSMTSFQGLPPPILSIDFSLSPASLLPEKDFFLKLLLLLKLGGYMFTLELF